MLVIEADIHEYVRMSYVDKNILGPLVHIHCTGMSGCIKILWSRLNGVMSCTSE